MISQEEAQADLIRTLAVINQYPDNGYQRRFRKIYNDALEIQAEWLAQTEADPIRLDPRTTDREDLLLQILGPERYFTDVGFTDWKKAIATYRKGPNLTAEEKLKLYLAENDKGHFISMRRLLQSQAHQTAMQTNGDKYITRLTQQQRSDACAMIIILTTALATGPVK